MPKIGMEPIRRKALTDAAIEAIGARAVDRDAYASARYDSDNFQVKLRASVRAQCRYVYTCKNVTKIDRAHDQSIKHRRRVTLDCRNERSADQYR